MEIPMGTTPMRWTMATLSTAQRWNTCRGGETREMRRSPFSCVRTATNQTALAPQPTQQMCVCMCAAFAVLRDTKTNSSNLNTSSQMRSISRNAMGPYASYSSRNTRRPLKLSRVIPSNTAMAPPASWRTASRTCVRHDLGDTQAEREVGPHPGGGT